MIITRGFVDGTIITRGFGKGFIQYVIRKIVYLKSYITKNLPFNSRIIK
jgi:hypothetical protein